MRIGIIAPPWFAVPPQGYGGIERVVSYLADGLVDLGHEVTLFAAGGSRTKAKLVTTFEAPPSARIGDPLLESEHLIEAYSRWSEFDIIHDHTALGLPSAAAVPIPVVHTIHGKVTPEFASLYRRAAGRVHYIAISENQRSTLPAGVEAHVIYNAVDLPSFPFREEPGQYLLFVGRANPDKGIVEAIEIARQAGKRLVLAVKINEVHEHEYFELVVRPRLAEVDHTFYDQVSQARLQELYANALATLFPIRWPEPFGLVMIESMATGTPVIAFRNGSVPEVIEDGVTGRICESIDEAVAAVGSIDRIDRAACRERVRERFSASVSVARHEGLYARIVAAHRAPRQFAGGPETQGEPLAT